jgi:hypothetical protein
MYKKLTLKLDESVIQYAKDYAAQYDSSVSKMVEDYFRNIAANNRPKKQYSPLVEELSGVISPKDLENIDYVTYLEQKYE